jgi:hypothetical protein
VEQGSGSHIGRCQVNRDCSRWGDVGRCQLLLSSFDGAEKARLLLSEFPRRRQGALARRLMSRFAHVSECAAVVVIGARLCFCGLTESLGGSSF